MTSFENWYICIYFNMDWVIPKLKCQLNAANDEMVWFDWLDPVNDEME